MRYLLIILSIFLLSCELFEPDEEPLGICIYEYSYQNGSCCWYEVYCDKTEDSCYGDYWYEDMSCGQWCSTRNCPYWP